MVFSKSVCIFAMLGNNNNDNTTAALYNRPINDRIHRVNTER